jgi:hypothetical protein
MGTEFLDTDEFQASKHCYTRSLTVCDHLRKAFDTRSNHSHGTFCVSAACQLPHEKLAKSTTMQICTATKAVAAKQCQCVRYSVVI